MLIKYGYGVIHPTQVLVDPNAKLYLQMDHDVLKALVSILPCKSLLSSTTFPTLGI
jgi:hypothetical protein